MSVSTRTLGTVPLVPLGSARTRIRPKGGCQDRSRIAFGIKIDVERPSDDLSEADPLRIGDHVDQSSLLLRQVDLRASR